jgi:hypothetical protein
MAASRSTAARPPSALPPRAAPAHRMPESAVHVAFGAGDSSANCTDPARLARQQLTATREPLARTPQRHPGGHAGLDPRHPLLCPSRHPAPPPPGHRRTPRSPASGRPCGTARDPVRTVCGGPHGPAPPGRRDARWVPGGVPGTPPRTRRSCAPAHGHGRPRVARIRPTVPCASRLGLRGPCALQAPPQAAPLGALRLAQTTCASASDRRSSTGARPFVAMIAARAASVGRSRGEMLGIVPVRALRLSSSCFLPLSSRPADAAQSTLLWPTSLHEVWLESLFIAFI